MPSSTKDPQIAKTHDVFNQTPPLEAYNLYDSDTALKETVLREGGDWAEQDLQTYGALAGGEMLELGFKANIHKPELHTHDRYGHRIDEVHYDPAYHRLMELAISHGIPSRPWKNPQAGAHVARAALMYLHNQVEAGTCCPLTMTFASIPTIQKQPSLANSLVPRILSQHYDPRNLPPEQKAGITVGMAMTEKQGGSDVRANSTRAYPLGAVGGGEAYELTGHKWFCSAPMCDAFLVLAYTEAGLSCFLLPRWRPDGTRNRFYIQRLKDKLGNHSNASSEVEFREAFAWMVGEEGRGVPTIIEMVALTRFDCAIGSASLMRQATVQAVHHAYHRQAFGKKLVDQPLMQNVLADLALESEAALALALRLARALDLAPNDEGETNFFRLATALGKYWICKRTPAQVNEAQECLGGAGYVEEFILPRLYREAPLNSIWEGSGNIQCLDVLRAITRNPQTLKAYFAEIKRAQGVDWRLDAYIDILEKQLANPENFEYRGRRLVEKMALALQGALLVRAGNSAVSDAFCAARLDSDHGLAFGTLPPNLDYPAIIERARPVV